MKRSFKNSNVAGQSVDSAFGMINWPSKPTTPADRSYYSSAKKLQQDYIKGEGFASAGKSSPGNKG